MAGQTTRH